ncbi:LysR family transcriptional regulator [Kluyvera genomosp. 1]|uniref:LysR family transcriptional regulator n=1 Tax=Kluyvera genomosp. 1 TaxID=2774053 RepID=UPI00068BECFE|nr:LysR family transcriptional regulator [Kluyvera genomosp. 1]
MKKLQIKPQELKIIAVIAASENISHAAAILGMAQANVSKYLSDVESKIGLRIFERSSRNLSLTRFGESLLPYVNDLLEKENQLNNFIDDYKHEKNGRVTIYSPTMINAYLARNVVNTIKDIGNISLYLKTFNLEPKSFYEGSDFPDDCDILISCVQPKNESLVASFITKYAVSAFASTAYLAKHPIHLPEELEHHSCILQDSMLVDNANIWRFSLAGSEEVRDFRVTGNYICDNNQSALELARNGLGIVFAPKNSVQADIQAGVLAPCFAEQYEWWLDLVAIYRKREYQPWRVQFILDAVLEEIRRQVAQPR